MPAIEYKDRLISEATAVQNDGWTVQWAKRELKNKFAIDLDKPVASPRILGYLLMVFDLEDLFLRGFQRDLRFWYRIDHAKYHYLSRRNPEFRKMMQEIKAARR